MQTFLPFESFNESAKVLDHKRLGKQRVETKQIYLALTEPTYGWKNHPAVRQWDDHLDWLINYGITVCLEWRSRGYGDTLLDWFSSIPTPQETEKPWWLGYEPYHASHRANLRRKDPVLYLQFLEDPSTPYFWPSKHSPPPTSTYTFVRQWS